MGSKDGGQRGTWLKVWRYGERRREDGMMERHKCPSVNPQSQLGNLHVLFGSSSDCAGASPSHVLLRIAGRASFSKHRGLVNALLVDNIINSPRPSASRVETEEEEEEGKWGELRAVRKWD